MTAQLHTTLSRHGALWGGDPWYRAAWLVGPQVAGLMVIGWLFATPGAPEPPRTPGTWIHPIHGADELAALRGLRDRAATDQTARGELEAKANGGNSSAQFFTGTLYDPKLHLIPPAPDNVQKAVGWYRKAADHGVDAAATNLGLLLMVGASFGLQTDMEAARALFTRAAPTYPPAQRELGLMRQRGWGEPEDPAGGFELIRKAAEHGDGFAQRLVGEACDRGSYGLAADPRQAVDWFRKAADKDDAVAQRELGLHLKAGRGVEADPDGATAWLRKAAQKGDAIASAELNATATPK